jgi:hypothetical protein
VREHDRLDAVAEVELLEDVRDVGARPASRAPTTNSSMPETAMTAISSSNQYSVAALWIRVTR